MSDDKLRALIEVQGQSLVVQNDDGYGAVIDIDYDTMKKLQRLFGDEVFDMPPEDL